MIHYFPVTLFRMAAFIVTPYVTNYEWLALSKVSALHVYIYI